MGELLIYLIRNFEFKVTAVPHYNVEVSLKITRGMTVMCSLAADSLMDAKFIVEGMKKSKGTKDEGERRGRIRIKKRGRKRKRY